MGCGLTLILLDLAALLSGNLHLITHLSMHNPTAIKTTRLESEVFSEMWNRLTM